MKLHLLRWRRCPLEDGPPGGLILPRLVVERSFSFASEFPLYGH